MVRKIRNVLKVYLTTIILAFVFTTPVMASNSLKSALHDAVNTVRTSSACSLKANTDKKVSKIADYRAEECSRKWSHEQTDGTKVFDNLQKAGYSKNYLGENLAYITVEEGTSDTEIAEQIVKMWVDSPTHNDNLNFSEFGSEEFGIFKEQHSNGMITIYVAQLFY